MKKILLIVDLQKGFARYPQTEELVGRINQLVDSDYFDVICATRFLNENNSMYEKFMGWNKLKDSQDQKLSIRALDKIDYIQDKYIYNCVTPSFISRLSQLNDGEIPHEVYIAGADTDCCVLTIATSLFENAIRPLVLANYCSSNGGEEAHRAGLKCLERLIGKDQIIYDNLIEL